MLGKIGVALCFLACLPAFAGVDLNQLSYAGTGCPADGAGIRANFSSYVSRLVVYMPDMKVDRDGAAVARKVCSLSLPVEVSDDERLIIGRPSVFGKNSLAVGEQLEVLSEVFYAGGTGPSVSLDLEGEGRRRRDFYKMDHGYAALPCGQDAILRTRSVILATAGSAQSSGEAELRGIALDMHIEPCGN